MNASGIRCVLLTAEWTEALQIFLKVLQDRGIETHFHPHPFTAAGVGALIDHARQDLYVLMLEDNTVVGYGMLRGWDDGYDIPSLGLAIHPDRQAAGLGRQLMEHLHDLAREKGAAKIRIKVYPDNTRAFNLYRDLGYQFDGTENKQRVGYLELR